MLCIETFRQEQSRLVVGKKQSSLRDNHKQMAKWRGRKTFHATNIPVLCYELRPIGWRSTQTLHTALEAIVNAVASSVRTTNEE